ncbi:MAG: hypothetical protein HC822_03600 [Oscillochloris sp.]|nr:hypothetical protein [Oscillochloris sp.]
MMHDPRSYWEELAAAALIGTARRPNLPSPPAPLAELVPHDIPDPAAMLLDIAAATAIYVRAGALPPLREMIGFPPAPHDAQPACSAEAARHLALILEDSQRTDLPEWLAALIAAGLRLPDARLPDLLDLGRTQPELRDLIRPALGARGRWLADLNPEWGYTQIDLDPLTSWQDGDRLERRAALALLRAADPEHARDLMIAAWPNERADERVAFVEIMAPGLRMADEPWLEDALNDRSREVRRQVADLLTRLPGSRLAGRMTTRALRYVQLEWGRKISVTLPNACDEAMIRDGIEPRPPRSGLGERAWWLMQIIARTPPAIWLQRWNLAPADILGVAPDEWRPLLIEGWQSATTNYADVEWATALVTLALAGDATIQLESLITVLPARQRDDLLIRMFAANHHSTGRELAVLRALPIPWSDRVAHAALVAVARHLRAPKNDPRSDWPLRIAVDYAEAIPPDLVDLAITLLKVELADRSFWNKAIPAFLDRLRFRRSMLAALQRREA